MSSPKRYMLIVISGLVMAVGFVTHDAWSAGLVSEVSVGTDCKRLIVKTEGRPEIEQIFIMNQPSRLVVDFKNTRLAWTSKKIRYEDQPIREVRAACRGNGTRLVVEFVGRVVPEHRVREIDDHLIILLDEFVAASSESESDGRIATGKRRSAVIRGNSEKVAVDKPDHPGLKIKSAYVSNGMIVLDVTTAGNPNERFRIDLGVDLKELGFSTADIRRHNLGREKRARPLMAKKAARRIAGDLKGTLRGSTRFGMGSLRKSKRIDDKGLFDAAKLKTRKFRASTNHIMPVVEKCGYSPKQNHSSR
jgi:AMIN domain